MQVSGVPLVIGFDEQVVEFHMYSPVKPPAIAGLSNGRSYKPCLSAVT
jgi:hypothetical protein